jgi:small-conductance mechanosensitive channel
MKMIDVVFLIDTTGSVTVMIKAAHDQATEMAINVRVKNHELISNSDQFAFVFGSTSSSTGCRVKIAILSQLWNIPREINRHIHHTLARARELWQNSTAKWEMVMRQTIRITSRSPTLTENFE